MSALECRQVRVWDLWLRIGHWSLAACVLANLFPLSDGDEAHELVGYGAVVLVGLRLLRGIWGPQYARLADFFPSPRRLYANLRDVLAGRRDDYPGHHPLGAVVMLLMLLLVLALGLTGWMMGTDRFWAEEWLMNLHDGLALALKIIVAIHLCAGIAMSFFYRSNLIWAMITGVKTLPDVSPDKSS